MINARKLLMILFYIFTPEHADASFRDAGKADYSTLTSFPGKIKGLFWVFLSIASIILVASFFK